MNTTHTLRKRKREPVQRRGIACVELAMVLPFLIIIVIGVVEVGNALRASHALESALREGGRLAIVSAKAAADNDHLNQRVIRDVRAFVCAAGFSGKQVAMTIQASETESPVTLGDRSLRGTTVCISASLPYSTIQVFPRRFLSADAVSNSIVIRIPEQ